MGEKKQSRARFWGRFALLTMLLACFCVFMYRCANPYRNAQLPSDEINTKWTCSELNLYFIVDKHGDCFGETVINGEREYLSACASYEGAFIVTEENVTSLKDIARNKDYGKTLLSGWYTYPNHKARTITVRVSPRDTYTFGELTEEIFLHFTREDLDEEICFWGEGCVKCGEDKH